MKINIFLCCLSPVIKRYNLSLLHKKYLERKSIVNKTCEHFHFLSCDFKRLKKKVWQEALKYCQKKINVEFLHVDCRSSIQRYFNFFRADGVNDRQSSEDELQFFVNAKFMR